MFIYSVKKLPLLVISLILTDEILADSLSIISQTDVFNTLSLPQPYLLSSDHRSCTGAFCFPQPLTDRSTGIGLSNSMLPDALSNYLIPQNISLQQQNKMQVELQQLHDTEQQMLEASSEGVIAKQAKMYFAMNSGQARVILFFPEALSKEQKKDWLNALVDDLFSMMKPLLRYEQNLEDKEDSPTEHALIAMTGGGDDDPDPDPDPEPSLQFYFVDPENRYQYSPMPMQLLLEELLKDKFSVLQNIWQRLHQAIIDGNRDLAFILRDRLMVISADMEDLVPILSTSMLPVNLASELSDELVFFHELQQLYLKNHLTSPFFNQDKPYGKQSPPKDKSRGQSKPKEEGDQGDSGSKPSDHNFGSSENGSSENADGGGEGDNGNTEDNNNGGDGSDNPEDESDEKENSSLRCTKCGETLTRKNIMEAANFQLDIFLCDECLDFCRDAVFVHTDDLEAVLSSLEQEEREKGVSNIIQNTEGLLIGSTQLKSLYRRNKASVAYDEPLASIDSYRTKLDVKANKVRIRLPVKYDPVIESLIEEFLEIPMTDFLPLDDSLRANAFITIKNFLDIDRQGESSASVLRKLIKAVLGLLLHQDKQIAREEFSKVIESAILYDVDLSGYVRSWITLWRCKQVVDGELEHKQELVSSLREPLASYNDDLLGLRLLLHCGALPHCEEFGDYESLLKLICSKNSVAIVTTPVSFTSFDKLRTGCFNENVISDIFLANQSIAVCNKFFLFYACARIMKIVDLDVVKINQDTWREPFINIACQDLKLSRKMLANFSCLAQIADKTRNHIQSFDGDDNRFHKKEWIKAMRFLESLRGKVEKELYTVLPQVFHASVLSNEPYSMDNSKVMARHFQRIARYYPAHWRVVFNWYNKARMFKSAAEAAEKMSEFWQPINPLTSAYWNEVGSNMRELSFKKNKQLGSVNVLEDNLTVEEAMMYIGIPDSPVSPVDIDRKKKIKLKVGVSSINAASKTEDDHDKEEDKAQEYSESIKPESIKKAVIPVKRYAANVIDSSQSPGAEWQVKKKTGSIMPHERLLSKNWNRKIRIALQLIHKFRDEYNVEQENEVYRTLLNDTTQKTLIGIERIWEEKAWTTLRSFDHFTRIAVMPRQERERVKRTVNQVRQDYLLPALAMKLGLDQMNSEIEAEEIKRTAEYLLQQPDFQDPSIQKEFRFRLRCLFSSMGHVYNLLALATPSQMSALGDIARRWYSYTTIYSAVRIYGATEDKGRIDP